MRQQWLLVSACFALFLSLASCQPATNLTTQENLLLQLSSAVLSLRQELAQEREKRVDLENVISQLPSLIVKELSTIIKKRIDELRTDVPQWKPSYGQRVFFSAKLGKHLPNIEPWQTIVFDMTDANEGGAYNNVTGEFNVTTAGWYVFQSTIVTKTGSKVEAVMKVNGTNKMFVYSGGNSGQYDSGSNMAILHLKPGEVVKMVKLGPWGTRPFYIHPYWSTFSGFLLAADEGSKNPPAP